MIDPNNITNYKRSVPELEEFILFSLVVAGKTASTQTKLLNNFLENLKGDSSFDKIRKAVRNNTLLQKLKESRLGQYNRLVQSFEQVLSLDLKTCSIDDLEKIHGIGPKTARMFLMHSRKNQRVAALDTHLLKHLRANGIQAPKATPSSKKLYRQLENDFLKLVDQSGMTVADYDLMIWRQYARV